MRIGGRSLLDSRGLPDQKQLERAVQACKEIATSADKLVLILGGAGAHHFIETARALYATEEECDAIGSTFCFVAAQTFLCALKRHLPRVFPEVIGKLNEIGTALETHDCVVLGPLTGSAVSSDSVATIAAEHIGADLLVFVKRWHLFEILPDCANADSGLRGVSLDEVVDFIRDRPEHAGDRPLLDFLAIRILQRASFQILVIKFEELKDLAGYLEGSLHPKITEILTPPKIRKATCVSRLREVMPMLIEEARNLTTSQDDIVHDLDHITRTVSVSLHLTDVYRHATKEVVELSAWWHDVGRIHGAADHEQRSAGMLSERLAKLGFESEFISEFTEAIAFHRWTAQPRSLEGTIIRDADKLDFVSIERWQAWSSLINSGHPLDIEELRSVSSKIPSLGSILTLQSSILILRQRKYELSQSLAAIGDPRVSALLREALIA